MSPSFKTSFVSVDFVPSSILSSYLGYLVVVWVILINFIYVCFRSVLVQTKVRFVISSLNQCSSCYKLYSCLSLLLVFLPYLCHVFTKREGKRRIVDQRCEKLSHGLGVLEREVDKCVDKIIILWSSSFIGKRGTTPKEWKMKESRCGYHSKVCTQVVSTACLFEIFVGHYYIVLLEKGVSNKGIPKA